MQSGELVRSDASSPTSRVLVNGVARPHASWSVDRDLAGDLPEAVAGAAGVRQATGSIEWSAKEDASDKARNPWNAGAGWLPQSGDIVEIWAGDGMSEWKQFHGVVHKTTGSVGGGHRSEIVDRMDALDAVFDQEAIIRRHPPKVEGGEFMGVGMSAIYMVDRAMRYGGFYTTPRLEYGAAFAVHGQGSMWPRLGTMTRGGSVSGGSNATNNRAPWGWAVDDFDCAYAPAFTQAGASPVQMTFCVAPDHAGDFFFRAIYDGTVVEVACTAGRTCVARMNGTEVCRLVLGGEATIVTLLVRGTSWQIRSNTGGANSASGPAVPAASTLSSVVLKGSMGTRTAGFQVSSPTPGVEFASLSHMPNALHRSAGLIGWMDALPSFAGRSALDVLTEISRATLSAMWIDETGVLQFRSSDVLRATTPRQTLTTLDDIHSLSWSESLLSTRSRVVVKYQQPAIDISRWSNIQFWQASGETMQSDQEKNLLAEAPASEDWAEIDHFGVGTAGGIEALNAGRGSWVMHFLEKSDGSWIPTPSGQVRSSLATVSVRARKFHIATGALVAGYHLILGTPDTASNYSPRFRGWRTPVLRGRGRVQWTEASVASGLIGPEGAPELAFDGGKWNSRSDDTLILQKIADFIASQVSTHQPVITGMRVGFDPRRQLGDVVTISSPGLMGVELKALIVGKSDQAGDSFTQSLSVRIIEARSTFTTYEQFNAAGGTLSHAQWQLLAPTPLTYAQHNAQPSEAP